VLARVRRSILLLAFVATGCGATVGSIGAVMVRNNETNGLRVTEVPPGLGAADAGMLPGDEVLMIDGFYVKDMTAKQIKALLRGEVGSFVELTVLRSGTVRHLKVKRSVLKQHEVKPREETIKE
jgi:C-terminal processing protease CtpA/Prc